MNLLLPETMTLPTMSRSRSLDDNNDVADRRAVCGCPRMVGGSMWGRDVPSLIPCETCRVIFKSASSDSLTNRNFRMLRPETGRNLKVKRYKHVHLAPSTTLPLSLTLLLHLSHSLSIPFCLFSVALPPQLLAASTKANVARFRNTNCCH